MRILEIQCKWSYRFSWRVGELVNWRVNELYKLNRLLVEFEIFEGIAGILQELLEVGEGNHEGGGVDAGMEADLRCFLQVFIEEDVDVLLLNVDEPEWSN